MLTLEQVVERLHDRNIRKVAGICELDYQSVCRLVREPSDKCEYRTVKKLSDYLEGKL